MPPAKTEVPAAELVRALEDFLADHPCAAVLEDGRMLFEMHTSRYALNAEHGRCVLQLWSEDRNMVRTVTGMSARKDTPRIETLERVLTRAFGDYNIDDLSGAIDLEHSFGPAYCREHSRGQRAFEGLKVIMPAGSSDVTRARMAWLRPALARNARQTPLRMTTLKRAAQDAIAASCDSKKCSTASSTAAPVLDS